MKSKKHGRSSIQSKKNGRNKRSKGCTFTRRDPGALMKRTSCWREMAGLGGGCDDTERFTRWPIKSPPGPIFPPMPAVAETFSLGAPVEIGRIDKELKKLWADAEGVMTRASLINL